MGGKKYSEESYSRYDDDSYWYGKGKSSTYTPSKRCYESHKPLPITVNDVTYLIYGGSCSAPVVTDADVYIGFDHYMKFSHKPYPWEPQANDPVIEFQYSITDMCAPHDPESFKAMVDWVCNQLHSGKKIHAGCIGGHGRTGTFLAAVYAKMTGDLDAITYVRKNYCQKAVESHTQVEFLHKHFGIVKVAGAKESHSSNKVVSLPKTLWPSKGAYGDSAPPQQKSLAFGNSSRTLSPVPGPKSIWGKIFK